MDYAQLAANLKARINQLDPDIARLAQELEAAKDEKKRVVAMLAQAEAQISAH